MNPAILRQAQDSALDRLEFPQLKALLRARLTSPPGIRALDRLRPSTDRTWIERELARVAEARALLEEGEEAGLGGLVDPQPLLDKLGVANVVLSPEELLDLAGLLSVATLTRQQLGAARYRQRLPQLRGLAGELTDFTALERDIRRRILPGGELDDHASPQLAELRAEIQKTEKQLHRTLKRLREKAAERGALQEDYVTLRGGRLVLPIRSDARVRPEGVIHAASGTGQTVFLEPLATINLNNELVRLREEEAAEIRRILRDLTERLAARRVALEKSAAVLGELDTLFARARYARDFRCTLPALSRDHTLTLTAARHPLLEAARKAELDGEVVPISLRLTGENHVLVISGPNAGGKTAALKTLGLAALATQAGIPVPAEEAQLPVFAHVLADIGDEQSLAANLSTFSAHILNLRAMAAEADKRALVLIDELGAATSPEEGAALGIALLEHFRQRGALTVATTHHERLKAYAASTPGAMNAAVEFDEEKLQPTYRLLLGVPGVSSGLEMAARLGLPADILGAARQRLATEVTETSGLIRSLHQTRQELERLQGEVREELESLRRERQEMQRQWLGEQRKRLLELERNLQGIIAGYRLEMQQVVDSLKDPSTGLRAGRKLREKLEKVGKRQLSKVQAELKHEFDTTVVQHLGESARPVSVVRRVDPEALQPGAKVKLRGIARRGVILSKIDAQTVEVQIGSLRMRTRIDDLEFVERDKEKRPSRATVKAVLTTEAQRTKKTATEIDVRGLRVEEALAKVDKFLDQAVLAGQAEVRLIHGLGTGALKKALAEFLASHPHVESTREAERHQGGSGATLVNLQRKE